MKVQRLVLAIVLAIVCALPVIAQNDPIKDGQFYIREEQYNKAVEALNKAPESSQKNALLGEAYFYLNQNDLAKSSFQKAAADPTNYKATIGLLALDLRSGDKAKADIGFEKITKANKKNTDVYATVVRYCLGQSVPDTALANKYLSVALKVNYKTSVLHVLHGDINSIASKFGAAANDYERAFYYDANNVEAYRKVGIIYARAKSFKQSSENFTKCIQIDPSQILVYKNQGDLFYLFGKYTEAEASYKIYIERADISTDDTERYAFTLFYTKKYDEANALLDKLIGKSKSEHIIYRLKGYMAYESQNYAASVESLNKFFTNYDASKFFVSDYSYYARALSKTGKDTLAIENYEKALMLVVDSTSKETRDLMEEVAKLYSRNKMHDKAIATYRSLINSGADASSMNFNIGREYYFKADAIRLSHDTQLEALKGVSTPALDSMVVEMKGIFAKSQVAFEESAKLSPNSYINFIYIGRVQSILDPESLTTGAKDSYEKALAILEAGDVQKNKKPLMECYRSLGSYYYLNSERAKGSEANELKAKSISYFEKILVLDPADVQAKSILEALKTK